MYLCLGDLQMDFMHTQNQQMMLPSGLSPSMETSTLLHNIQRIVQVTTSYQVPWYPFEVGVYTVESLFIEV